MDALCTNLATRCSTRLCVTQMVKMAWERELAAFMSVRAVMRPMEPRCRCLRVSCVRVRPGAGESAARAGAWPIRCVTRARRGVTRVCMWF